MRNKCLLALMKKMLTDMANGCERKCWTKTAVLNTSHFFFGGEGGGGCKGLLSQDVFYLEVPKSLD